MKTLLAEKKKTQPLKVEENKEHFEKILLDDKNLREVLENLNHEGNNKRLNLLRERLKHRTEVYQTSNIRKVNDLHHMFCIDKQ